MDKIPPAVMEAISNAEKWNFVSKGIKVEISDIKYFPAQRGKTNVIFGFKTSEEESTGTEEGNTVEDSGKRILALRLYDIKNKKDAETNFFSIDIDPSYKKSDTYYFEFQAGIRSYEIVMFLSKPDLSELATTKRELKVPDMYPQKLGFSSLLLYKKMERLPQVPAEFKVYKNSFPLGVFLLYPIKKGLIEPDISPSVLFFVNGASLANTSKKFKLRISYTLKKDDKVIVKYKPKVVNSNLLAQPLPVVVKGEKLNGEYDFDIEVTDLVNQQRANKKISLKYL